MKLQTVRFRSAVILLLRYLVMSLKQAHNSNWLVFMHVLTYFVNGGMNSFTSMAVLFSSYMKKQNITLKW